jgi:hypothetical protein
MNHMTISTYKGAGDVAAPSTAGRYHLPVPHYNAQKVYLHSYLHRLPNIR